MYNRTLNRPMFRRGGRAGGGIMTGVQRQGYAGDDGASSVKQDDPMKNIQEKVTDRVNIIEGLTPKYPYKGSDFFMGLGANILAQPGGMPILQTIGILTQPIILELPQFDTFKNIDKMKGSVLYKILGNRYKFEFEMLKPSLNFWVFAIGSEHEGVFGDQLERLHEVFDMIPVIPNLNNTIDLVPSVFHTTDPEHINIQFFAAPTLT